MEKPPKVVGISALIISVIFEIILVLNLCMKLNILNIETTIGHIIALILIGCSIIYYIVWLARYNK